MAKAKLKKKITSNLGWFDNESSQFKMSNQHDMAMIGDAIATRNHTITSRK